MNILARAIPVGSVLTVLLSFAGVEFVAAAPVAGLTPDLRPADAPTITEPSPPGATALHGVTSPTPETVVKFMRDQGNWYTPFTVPGMPGPYDIRGWHAHHPAVGKR